MVSFYQEHPVGDTLGRKFEPGGGRQHRSWCPCPGALGSHNSSSTKQERNEPEACSVVVTFL